MKIPFSRFTTLMEDCVAVTVDGDLSFPSVDTNSRTVEITNTDEDGQVFERWFDEGDDYRIDADGSILVINEQDEEFCIRLLNTVKATP